ncbi:division/cell wall cluster transcriptional repressor MraZ [Neptunomonas marina]|uniref:Transcriptional regulator MraZ n=1 Tax=Neptunomonas marina TaxID=1815562 RepID=A0A437Q7F3_9GAMM|nr:division/cell wall cluster transcriptional repressor MraZ [Neptunomonas marina]RVU30474.1 transcriptional regulator MraZ [Neptunomonas marina]
MFRGVNQVNLDVKGRMAIPARYRDQIADQCAGHLVMTIDTEERCLLLYPTDEWEKIQRQIDALPSFDPMTRRLQRLLVGHATDLDMDKSGRVLVPAPLREYAGLEKRIILLGQGRKFEVWDEDRWNATRDSYLEDVGSTTIPEALATLSL